MAPVRASASSGLTEATWSELLMAIRRELATPVERAVDSMRAMPSYGGLDRDAVREGVVRSYEAILDGLAQRRRPGAGDDTQVFVEAGKTRSRQGVAVTEMLTIWRNGLEFIYELAGEVAPPGPDREALLLEFLELTLAWADFAMIAAADGHRTGELSRVREQQHAQTNFVRRVLSGAAAPAEIRSEVAPLGLAPDALYHAVRARIEPSAGVEAIERYLGADGLVSRGNGLVAVIDGDVCGFVRGLPKAPAPTAIGVSKPMPLSTMELAFHRAGRALDTAWALGARGVFGLADLGVQIAVASDADVGEAMVETYVDSVLAVSGGEVVLDTVERYLANERSVETSAHDLGVHSNTIRHRLTRFEEVTGRSLRDTETLVETWWALQKRRLSSDQG